ncbi:predicted protein [Thalassiosira pseudonana CCMP1335]|uniref:Dynein regulatory complex protein 1/2 N-terminal domain-containing protein n=1 Tax=Thalassiosira pseudonana TaxID=35128 RepID=B5YLX2_THAPS|nr:predicted protein [Thalassiosira pseudonana CCMP1335]ACI64152.1 predicted protein [Thalassiosira pseudonana CCMP1335]
MKSEETEGRRKQLRRIDGNVNNDDMNEKKASSEDDRKYTSDQQVSTSFTRLDDIQTKSTNLVTEARVSADQREAKRRDDEEEEDVKRHELADRVNECKESEGINLGWQRCSSATNAQDLCELLDQQKIRCEDAISKIEAISRELGSQLRQKDHEYVTALKRNRQEIEKLQNCITKEHQVLKEAFETELKLIEESFNADRKQIMETKKSELSGLVSERNKMEIASLEHQREIIDDQRREIKESESKGDHDSSSLKEKLEKEMRRLEIVLEDTRARHQFDSDKLEFEVRVLTEVSANASEVKKQKRRIMKGKEKLNREIEANHREQSKGAKENQILEDDCERIERQASGLKEKFERFKISDDEKYKAILALHNDDLQKLQIELKESQEFIFGGAIGCSKSDELSRITSDALCANEGASKVELDEIELEVNGSGDQCRDSDRNDEWTQAETLMSNYKIVLERRENLNAECNELECKNAELENELKLKLQEKINEELAYPPSKMISVHDEKK